MHAGANDSPHPTRAQQYISAVEYLHNHHVAHRDLKLDNIVLDGNVPPRIKVCDFGFAKNWDSEANMFTQVRGGGVILAPLPCPLTQCSDDFALPCLFLSSPY